MSAWGLGVLVSHRYGPPSSDTGRRTSRDLDMVPGGTELSLVVLTVNSRQLYPVLCGNSRPAYGERTRLSSNGATAY